MRLTTRTRILAVPAAVALGASLFAVSLTVQVPTAQASSAAVDQRNEIYRLINGSRAAAGKSAVNVDVFLESVAGDGAIPCPDDSAKTIGGRAADIFTTGHMSHNLRLCDAATYTDSSTSFISWLQNAWKYGSVGEILGSNTGYGTGAYTFTYKAFQTSTNSTTGHMMAGWASSPSHWGIVMGQYNRVGCGVWAGGSTYIYACEFAGGSGPTPMGLRGAPRPVVPVRTPAPAATPRPTPAPSAIPIWTDYLAPLTLGQSYGSSASTPTPTPSPTVEPLRITDATATKPGAGAAGLQTGNDLMSDSSSAPAAVVRVIAFVAGSVAGLFSAILAFISMRRRRRGTAP